MLNPLIVDTYIARYTANELRDRLRSRELSAWGRAYAIVALYYVEENDND